jgi:hypothetical protein
VAHTAPERTASLIGLKLLLASIIGCFIILYLVLFLGFFPFDRKFSEFSESEILDFFVFSIFTVSLSHPKHSMLEILLKRDG